MRDVLLIDVVNVGIAVVMRAWSIRVVPVESTIDTVIS